MHVTITDKAFGKMILLISSKSTARNTFLKAIFLSCVDIK